MADPTSPPVRTEPATPETLPLPVRQILARVDLATRALPRDMQQNVFGLVVEAYRRGRAEASADALGRIAWDVVGVSDPARVHDDERLPFGAIRRALTARTEEGSNHA